MGPRQHCITLRITSEQSTKFDALRHLARELLHPTSLSSCYKRTLTMQAQAQATRTEVQSITATQSLAAIQTMLRAGLGCITYLRDLLPEENFTQSHLVVDEDSSIPYRRLENESFSSASSKQSRGSNGFKITTMTRGYSDEGDKILNYLENGIFDALQKEYLKSFIFAIYLDHNDPNNIIEAYTFNFQYHTSPDTGVTIPIMTLGEDLRQMSLNNARDSPVTEAAKRGKVPTLLDVKKSVKALLKTLIQATTQMDVLPKRRFATFKLYYTDKAPADYEPPYFQPGDEEKDKWYFMTHDLDEVPDKWSIGRVNTGHHSVNLSVTSIATYLPSSSSIKDATFGGPTLRSTGAPALTPAQEASLRAAQAEQQIMDAQTRRVAWSGDEAVALGDADGEAEDDPDYMLLPDGTYKKRVVSDVPGPLIPSGVKNSETGAIEPLCGPMNMGEAHFAGVSERVPTSLNELNCERMNEKSNVEQTQVVDDLSTHDVPMPSPSPDNQSSTPSVIMDPIFQSSRPESSWSSPPLSPITSIISRHSSDTDIDMVKEMHTQSIIDDTVPLDMETQMESIESFGSESAVKAAEGNQPTPRRTSSLTKRNLPDHGLGCECGVNIEDPSCFCEGGCGKWFHIWCMG
ncbi:hypothetical protein H2248_009230 [Termitomyces sp. 'cryptogamus']|nr:hypothetical protein H2248_009230 [Termitomyces sp. 'cryptogamus']